MTQSVLLPTGEALPALGQGTWIMRERASERRAEIASLRLGIELGLTLIDTAEMYAEGGAEEVVGEAVQGLRDRVFLVSTSGTAGAVHTQTPRRKLTATMA
jgi:diketogulonate reductase-like aldo/keto reductase